MKNKNRTALAVSLILVLVSILFAGALQTDWGRVRMTDITLVTEAGNLTGYLFKPDSATPEHPAPAVVCSHGYLNNREMQDCNYVELARRGYVVISMDDFSHGNSDVPRGYEDTALVRTNGMSAFVEYLSTLPYVDPEQIGVTGHSMGGQYTIETMTYYSSLERDALAAGMDPAEAHKLNKVNTGVVVGNYPTAMARNEKGETFLCHCSVIGAKYDEFFFSNTAVLLTSDNSKNLVSNLLESPASMPLEEGKTYVSPSTGYTVTLYNPAQFHATNHFSVKCVRYLLESFERSMPAPVKIDSGSQVWLLKELFNLVGLLGFFAFLAPFVSLMSDLPCFSAVKSEVREYDAPEKKSRYLRRNLWLGTVNSLLILPVLLIGYLLLCNPIWPQDTTGGIGLWTAVCGLMTLKFLKKDLGKKKWKDCREELGLSLRGERLRKTVLLSVLTAVAAFALLFFADAVNQTDFRFWCFDIRSFPIKKVWVAVRYLPFFLVFYAAQALSVSRSTFRGWSERKQILVCGLLNTVAPALMLIVTYLPTPLFQATTWVALCSAIGAADLAAVFALVPILLIPVVPTLFLTAAVSVKTYRATGNFWIGGFVNSLLITMITVANTSFTYPY